MTQDEIHGLVVGLGDIHVVLRSAEPEDKAEVYRQLGVALTYHPEEQSVRAEVNLDAHMWGYGSCPRGKLSQIPANVQL